MYPGPSAFAQVHSREYVIGDVKPQNVLLTRDARVTIIDNDSFQVVEQTRSGEIVHFCEVYSQGYLPPVTRALSLPQVLILRFWMPMT